MVTTICGENSYRLQQELSSRVTTFIAEHGDLALERLDASDAASERLQEALTSLPFLATKKLVVIRGTGANKAFMEQAPSLLADIPESTDVIIAESKLDKRSSYYKYLKSKTEFIDCAPLDSGALGSWLSHQATEKSGALSTADARFLIERVGTDQQLLASELEKLLLYNAKISRQTIELLTDQTPQSTIFQLLESAFAGNSRQALKLYAEQRALKVEPQQIIAMIAWQLHIVALLKTADKRSVDEVAQAAKLNPFVVRKSAMIARRLRYETLKQLISRLLQIDRDSKQGSLDLDEALQHYLLLLARPAN